LLPLRHLVSSFTCCMRASSCSRFSNAWPKDPDGALSSPQLISGVLESPRIRSFPLWRAVVRSVSSIASS
uniref:Secreted protein n=1 Tax=Echinostoma caproni TaxID=27848 RepID=A0A183A2C2_9TREM